MPVPAAIHFPFMDSFSRVCPAEVSQERDKRYIPSLAARNWTPRTAEGSFRAADEVNFAVRLQQ